MEHLVWLNVLGLTALLAVAVLLVPLANRLNFPYTVLLAIVGLALGAVIEFGPDYVPGFAGDFLRALQAFEISSEAVFFIFLPALVFESSLSIDVRRLMDDIAPILLLAVVGLLISTFVIGFSLNALASVGLLACLLLGAICSATDPVAVVAIFKELGAPKRLAILVEGESLFNDATAIVLFGILAGMLAGDGDSSIFGGVIDFLRVFLGGVAVGYVMARLLCLLLARLQDLPMVETTLTISLAYLSFIVAEHYLHVSGVMAVVTAALIMGSRGRTAVSPGTWHVMHETWEQLGFWANSVIFVLVGLAVPHLLADMGTHDLLMLGLLVLVAFAARAAIVFGLLPILSAAGLAQPVSMGYRAVMWWGGLRGAVSLALALAVLENTAFSDEVRHFVALLVTGFVMFTLFVNATTVRFMLGLFGLDKLSPADMALRERALYQALSGIGKDIDEHATAIGVDPESARDVADEYRERARKAHDDCSEHALSEEEWLRVGLTIAGNQERKTYLNSFADGLLATEVTRMLFLHVDEFNDAVKARGAKGYRERVSQCLGFSTLFRFALDTQHHLRWQGPLARQLADRFEILNANNLALGDLLSENWDTATALLPDATARRVRQLLEERLKRTEAALDALTLQYPEYSRRIQSRELAIIGLRREQGSYDRMLRDSVITPEVHRNLKSELTARLARLRHRPPLDLGLDAASLIAKVPFLNEHLDKDEKALCPKLLRPQLALPGEKIIRKGEAGHAMYFLSSGAVQVDIPGQPVQLGSGDFFGEIALVSDIPRNADVTAHGYCQLLALYRDDFQIILRQNDTLRRTIEDIAERRARETRDRSQDL